MREMLTVTAETLAELGDGSVGLALNRALQDVVRDLDDRAGLTAARTIVLSLTLKPRSNDGVKLEGIELESSVVTRIPKRAVAVLCLPTRDGGMETNVGDMSNPDQHTLKFGEEEIA